MAVELSKLMYLQLSQVKDVLREVINSVNKPQCPVEKDQHERLNVKLMCGKLGVVTERPNYN